MLGTCDSGTRPEIDMMQSTRDRGMAAEMPYRSKDRRDTWRAQLRGPPRPIDPKTDTMQERSCPIDHPDRQQNTGKGGDTSTKQPDRARRDHCNINTKRTVTKIAIRMYYGKPKGQPGSDDRLRVEQEDEGHQEEPEEAPGRRRTSTLATAYG